MAVTLPTNKDLETVISGAIERLQNYPDDFQLTVLVGVRKGVSYFGYSRPFWEIYTVEGDSYLYPNFMETTYWGSVCLFRQSSTEDALKALNDDLEHRISRNDPVFRPLEG